MVENVGLDINDPSHCVSRLISIHFSFSLFNLFPLPLCDQNKKNWVMCASLLFVDGEDMVMVMVMGRA